PYRILENAEGFIKIVDHEIAISGLEALLDSLRIYINPEKAAAGHGGRQGLCATHSAHPAAHDQLAGQVAAKVFFTGSGERLKCPLDNALGADIDPGASRHLAIHR